MRGHGDTRGRCGGQNSDLVEVVLHDDILVSRVLVRGHPRGGVSGSGSGHAVGHRGGRARACHPRPRAEKDALVVVPAHGIAVLDVDHGGRDIVVVVVAVVARAADPLREEDVLLCRAVVVVAARGRRGRAHGKSILQGSFGPHNL